MIRKNKTILSIIGILAFAVAAYFLFSVYKKGNLSLGREGLSRFSVQTIKVPSGWGYRIYQDTTAVIEQRFIPGAPGTQGFASQNEARKTGELVQMKLDQGIFPPSITTRDLDSLGVKY
ncbi:DUF4907 domain-containing protein [Dyadobacter pollutisoli]|uniref:DUF4907 domain-containing protein n=1 Tax=Dyadobacter pollutisoli TaxID=2910158 RepID=A0A9E8NDW8_9BACT|nr:DUF4907 domain-containing protein [Dyadobacter pollutisoli]WAC13192.1 DUF4907 domain-containing protein [Dyadobacter pollutisoli]